MNVEENGDQPTEGEPVSVLCVIILSKTINQRRLNFVLLLFNSQGSRSFVINITIFFFLFIVGI